MVIVKFAKLFVTIALQPHLVHNVKEDMAFLDLIASRILLFHVVQHLKEYVQLVMEDIYLIQVTLLAKKICHAAQLQVVYTVLQHII
jgi:hypothetical protein